MKIDKYELTKNNNYNVYLSNGEVLTLDERVITSNSLLLKKEIDSSLYDKLKIDNDIISLYNMAIKYINVRLRSERRLGIIQLRSVIIVIILMQQLIDLFYISIQMMIDLVRLLLRIRLILL